LRIYSQLVKNQYVTNKFATTNQKFYQKHNYTEFQRIKTIEQVNKGVWEKTKVHTLLKLKFVFFEIGAVTLVADCAYFSH
jgi:hypothetical protein